jgi:hypothetical protein
VYKLDSFVGFIGDEQFHAQECYESIIRRVISDFSSLLGHYAVGLVELLG